RVPAGLTGSAAPAVVVGVAVVVTVAVAAVVVAVVVAVAVVVTVTRPVVPGRDAVDRLGPGPGGVVAEADPLPDPAVLDLDVDLHALAAAAEVDLALAPGGLLDLHRPAGSGRGADQHEALCGLRDLDRTGGPGLHDPGRAGGRRRRAGEAGGGR